MRSRARQSKQQGQRERTRHDERGAPQATGRDAIGAVAKPDPGEAHELLTTDGQSSQYRGELDLLDEQSVQQTEHQHTEDSEAELEKPKTETQIHLMHDTPY